MRSLRSLNEKRACGSRNFGHLLQNDFCNRTHPETDINEIVGYMLGEFDEIDETTSAGPSPIRRVPP
jgi:hypothetical protein